jgi:hypothetical protein
MRLLLTFVGETIGRGFGDTDAQLDFGLTCRSDMSPAVSGGRYNLVWLLTSAIYSLRW